MLPEPGGLWAFIRFSIVNSTWSESERIVHEALRVTLHPRDSDTPSVTDGNPIPFFVSGDCLGHRLYVRTYNDGDGTVELHHDAHFGADIVRPLPSPLAATLPSRDISSALATTLRDAAEQFGVAFELKECGPQPHRHSNGAANVVSDVQASPNSTSTRMQFSLRIRSSPRALEPSLFPPMKFRLPIRPYSVLGPPQWEHTSQFVQSFRSRLCLWLQGQPMTQTAQVYTATHLGMHIRLEQGPPWDPVHRLVGTPIRQQPQDSVIDIGDEVAPALWFVSHGTWTVEALEPDGTVRTTLSTLVP